MVVIGAGLVGSAVAFALSRAGFRVVVVDRGGAAGGTSGACMGHLMMLSDPPEMYHATRRSVELWKRLQHDAGGFDLLASGCLWVGEVAEDMPLLEKLAEVVHGFGDEGTLWDGAELHRREPGLAADLAGAFHYPHDAVLFPMHGVGALLRGAVAAGAELRMATEVVGLELGPDGAVQGVQIRGGVLPAEAVVNAAGVWVPRLMRSRCGASLPDVPIFPRRGDLAITMPQHLPMRHQILEVGYLRTATGKAVDPQDPEPDPGAMACNVQPQGNRTLLIGSTRQFAGFDTSVNRRLLAAMLHRAARFVPSVGALQVVRTWAGLRPYTRDKRPIVGPVSGVPGLYLAGGHEGLGVTLSLVTGEILAAQLGGGTPHAFAAAFSPERFHEVGRAP